MTTVPPANLARLTPEALLPAVRGPFFRESLSRVAARVISGNRGHCYRQFNPLLSKLIRKAEGHGSVFMIPRLFCKFFSGRRYRCIAFRG